jgi:hypothetical protein
MTPKPRKWEGLRLTPAGYKALGAEPPAVEMVRPRPERYQVGVEYFLTDLGEVALSRPPCTDIPHEPYQAR